MTSRRPSGNDQEIEHGHHHADAPVHAHSHDHRGHSHAPASFGRAFGIGISLNVTFVLVEVIFGLRANSVALLADAGHNLGDVLGLIIAWWASVLVTRGPTARRTYGLRSTSILAALANAVLLLIAVGGITWEAIGRVGHPQPIAAATMIWVAAAGIVINAATALLFMSGRHTDLNLRGAYLHMAADAGVSAGVVVAGIVIAATGWLWLDPVISIGIAALIALGSWGLLRDSVNLALDAVPPHVDPSAVEQYLRTLPGVTGVHDLHIWGMSTTEVALTAHLIRPQSLDDDALLLDVARTLNDRFGIAHPTLQVERGHGPHDCPLAPAHVI